MLRALHVSLRTQDLCDGSRCLAMDAVQEIRLEPLRVVILDHGEKVRVVELSDPREDYIAEFNARCIVRGLTAEVAV